MRTVTYRLPLDDETAGRNKVFQMMLHDASRGRQREQHFRRRDGLHLPAYEIFERREGIAGDLFHHEFSSALSLGQSCWR
ncbi:hypothetical protein ATN84_22590 [Paramesorhizobium deserti]|uniref:Uncharacterized protein n=1 Tax=Paramesorhizobium deserti TaxID=1494590 RepID=A0A135HNH5_9HYPH|nr:hypothetical protein ATN84_22590 [Paramesorhizobium deserti]